MSISSTNKPTQTEELDAVSLKKVKLDNAMQSTPEENHHSTITPRTKSSSHHKLQPSVSTNEYVIVIPDHITSCREEIERQFKARSEHIEGKSEVLRELKRLKAEGKLEEVRKRCEKLQEEYNQKNDEQVNTITVSDIIEGLESSTSSDTDELESSTCSDMDELESDHDASNHSKMNDRNSCDISEASKLESSPNSSIGQLESSTAVSDIAESESKAVLIENELESDERTFGLASRSESSPNSYTNRNESVIVDDRDEHEPLTVTDTNTAELCTVNDLNQLSQITTKDTKLKTQIHNDLNQLESSTDSETNEFDSSSDTDPNEFELSANSQYNKTTEKIEKLMQNKKEKLHLDYEIQVCDYLQEQLNVAFNMGDGYARRKELRDIFSYYLMRGEEPDEHSLKIIRRLDEPLYDDTLFGNYGWYDLCCDRLSHEDPFAQFYDWLENDETALQYVIYKQPQFLLNKESGSPMHRLMDHIPASNLRQMIMNIRGKSGETCMFHIEEYEPFIKLYVNNADELYQLLSIQGADGQTALHVNTENITDLLAELYTPKQRGMFTKLTSMTDNNNKTALESSGHDKLSLLGQRVGNNEYVTNSYLSASILIIYNTHKRSGAEQEAKIIYDAIRTSRYVDQNITLEKDKTDTEMIELVKQTANQETKYGDLPTALIIILMSHGTVGTIDDNYGNTINLSEIEKVMCSEILHGKPKMLITQCCQSATGEIDKKLKPFAPTHDHFCAIMSTVSGQKSKRGIFIGKLAEKIKDSKNDTNIFKIANNVSREMEREGHKQTPIIMSTLKAEYFPTGDWSYSE